MAVVPGHPDALRCLDSLVSALGFGGIWGHGIHRE
jgi:hypothetical protein